MGFWSDKAGSLIETQQLLFHGLKPRAGEVARLKPVNPWKNKRVLERAEFYFDGVLESVTELGPGEWVSYAREWLKHGRSKHEIRFRDLILEEYLYRVRDEYAARWADDPSQLSRNDQENIVDRLVRTAAVALGGSRAVLRELAKAGIRGRVLGEKQKKEWGFSKDALEKGLSDFLKEDPGFIEIAHQQSGMAASSALGEVKSDPEYYIMSHVAEDLGIKEAFPEEMYDVVMKHLRKYAKAKWSY